MNPLSSPPLIEKAKNILIAIAAMIILMSISTIVLSYAWENPDIKLIDPNAHVVSLAQFLGVCIIAPLFEELLCRVLPFAFIRNSPNFERLKYPVLLLSAMIFGWLHGGPTYFYFQGIGGIVLGWVYLKNEFSYWSSVVVHFSWNFMLCVVIPLLIYHPTASPFGF